MLDFTSSTRGPCCYADPIVLIKHHKRKVGKWSIDELWFVLGRDGLFDGIFQIMIIIIINRKRAKNEVGILFEMHVVGTP